MIRVEWLYRAVRTMVTNPCAIETMEKEIISGTDEQRESWQTTIVEREQDKKPSPYFHSHDDWKPEPPEQEESVEDNDSGGWLDWLFTPTKNERAAQEAVRNNPNIPEGAKP